MIDEEIKSLSKKFKEICRQKQFDEEGIFICMGIAQNTDNPKEIFNKYFEMLDNDKSIIDIFNYAAKLPL